MIITYHASSDSDISQFSIDFHRSGFYTGLYSSTSLELVKSFGHVIYQLELTGEYFEFKDHQHEDQLVKASGRTSSGSEVVKSLIDKGFSGIKRGSEYITFNPESIKFKKL